MLLNSLNLLKQINRIIPLPAIRTYKRKQFSLESDYFRDHPIDDEIVEEIKQCNSARKTKGNTDLARELLREFEKESDSGVKNEIRLKLIREIRKFPNKTHPVVIGYDDISTNQEVLSSGEKPTFDGFKSKDFEDLSNILRVSRTSQLGNFTSSGSYYLMGDLAELVSVVENDSLNCI